MNKEELESKSEQLEKEIEEITSEIDKMTQLKQEKTYEWKKTNEMLRYGNY